jgi:hypothetical protein
MGGVLQVALGAVIGENCGRWRVMSFCSSIAQKTTLDTATVIPISAHGKGLVLNSLLKKSNSRQNTLTASSYSIVLALKKDVLQRVAKQAEPLARREADEVGLYRRKRYRTGLTERQRFRLLA